MTEPDAVVPASIPPGAPRGFFITATDTDVGKTFITAGLRAALEADGRRVAAFKPAQSGALADDPASDSAIIGGEALYSFAEPLAPLVAARLHGVEIELEPIVARARELQSENELLLVEGAGGLLVGIGEDFGVAEVAQALALPLILVARATLGTVNHVLLTLEAARARGLEPVAVVLNGPTDHSTEANIELVRARAGVPVVATVPLLPSPADAAPFLGDLVALARG